MTNTIFKNNTKIGNPYDFLDRNRHRKMVFYGRVSTEHEAQMAALENQIEWYDDQAKYHPNWEVLNKYIHRYYFLVKFYKCEVIPNRCGVIHLFFIH